MKKVLFISYIFPPIGGSGVQRRLKFAKYLPKFNWKPYVVTVKNILYYMSDNSLLNELSNEVEIYRTNSLDPLRLSKLFLDFLSKIIKLKKDKEDNENKKIIKYNKKAFIFKLYNILRRWFFLGDSTFLWLPFAYIKCCELIKKEKIDIIFSTSTPSAYILAYFLNKRFHLPYILDFSDGWLDDPYLKSPTKLHKIIIQKLELLTIRKAKAVTVYGNSLKEIFHKKYGNLLKNRIKVIYNGYDAIDFNHLEFIKNKKYKENIHLVYSGSLYLHQKSCLISLFKALSMLPKYIQRNIRIDFVGNYFDGVSKLLKKFNLITKIIFHGYVSHHEALILSRAATHLILFIEHGNKSMVTGKLFEYIGLKKPILALIPYDGEASTIIKYVYYDSYFIVDPDDFPKLTKILEQIYHFPKLMTKPNNRRIIKFERKILTKNLVSLFDSTISKQ